MGDNEEVEEGKAMGDDRRWRSLLLIDRVLNIAVVRSASGENLCSALNSETEDRIVDSPITGSFSNYTEGKLWIPRMHQVILVDSLYASGKGGVQLS